MFNTILKICIIHYSFTLSHHEATLYAGPNWFDLFLKQIITEESPYQITVLIDDKLSNNGSQWESMLKTVATIFPAVLVNIAKFSDDEPLSVAVYKNPKAAHASYLMLLTNDSYFDRLKNVFQVIADPAFIRPRPKCILLYFGAACNSDIRGFFEYIWTLQFLDVFILKIDRNGDTPLKIAYNPFTNVISEEKFSSKSRLFPDKVNNVYHYPLKVPVYNDPPYLKAIRNEKHEVIGVGGTYYQYFATFFKAINCTLHYTHFNAKTYKEKHTVFLLLENNIFNMMTIPNMIGAFNKGNLVRSRAFATTKFIIVVPHLINSEVHVPLNALIVLFIFPVIVISFTIIARLLKFPRRTWGATKIFQILLGVSLQKQPRKFMERIVLLALIAFSMEYTTDFVAKLTGIKFLKKELSYDTFEELYHSDIPIYAGDFFTESFCKNFDDTIKKVLRKAKKVKNIFECYDNNLNNNPTICVAFHSQAIAAIEKFRAADGEPIMKVTELSFLEDYKAFPFEKSSPFVEKFNIILQRLIEAGIPKTWNYYRKNVTFRKKKDKANKNSFAVQLVVLLCAGHLLSIAAFIIEFICKYI